MSETNLQVLLKARPEGLPKESDFEIVESAVAEPEAGQVLVRQRYLSLDPAMRGWMMDRESYVPPVALGEVMRGFGVGEVVRSAAEGFAEGDVVVGLLGWQRYATLPGEQLERAPGGVPMPWMLGPLGVAGITAHVGLLDIGKPRPGDTVLVSGGAGAVGSMVGQIARIKDCRVVGIAGTDEKCAWLTDELGFDAAINYRTCGDYRAAIAAACPDGVDVYFDNVGGEILDAALLCLNQYARVAVCGWISSYNSVEIPHLKNLWQLVAQSVTILGFVVLDYLERFPEGIAQLAEWVMAGRLQFREEIVDGLDEVLPTFLRLFDGSNRGKLVIRIPE